MSTYGAITPTKSFTTKDAIQRFSPNDRECFTDEEFQLRHLKKKFGYRYSMRNCLYDIVLGNTIKNCSCFFPINHMETSKVYFKNYLLARRLSREVANLTERKKHPPNTILLMICLSVCHKLSPQLSQNWLKRMSLKILGSYTSKPRTLLLIYNN